MEITGFKFDDVTVNVSKTKKGEVVVIYQGGECIETTKENMNKICIQWLALNQSDALEGDL